jgi:hypothetical protein
MQMDNHQLQALRKLLFLDVSEAAKEIGEVTSRTWQRWEDGSRKVPQDVADQMSDWCQMYSDTLNDKRENKKSITYYKTFEDFESATGKNNVVVWRITQAIYSTLLLERLEDN